MMIFHFLIGINFEHNLRKNNILQFDDSLFDSVFIESNYLFIFTYYKNMNIRTLLGIQTIGVQHSLKH